MINWKLRLKNKATLVALIMAIISFIYFTLGVFGVVPKFEKELVVKVALGLVDLLAILGIVVDPTTAGIGDSERALSYDEPHSDLYDDEDEEDE